MELAVMKAITGVPLSRLVDDGVTPAGKVIGERRGENR
jgi:hypothetical protein